MNQRISMFFYCTYATSAGHRQDEAPSTTPFRASMNSSGDVLWMEWPYFQKAKEGKIRVGTLS
jgi:hypothetical protein